ncbi:SEFIR domain-containing protein [Spirosoma flavus]
MDVELKKEPAVFISYSWTTPEHEDWVVELAKRLELAGFRVVLDKWDLKRGHDKYHFMEMSVKSPDIDKVLIIIDKGYTEKADKRSGGVGTETLIISHKIYEAVDQEKFIPIVRERDDKGHPYMPAFLAGRVYLDFSNNDEFEEGFEDLMRDIVNKPAHRRPKRGTLPKFLVEEDEETDSFKTSYLVRGIDILLSKKPERVKLAIEEFLDEFYKVFITFKFKIPKPEELTNLFCGEQIINLLNEYKNLRNDFISFFDKITKNGHEIDVDILIKFFNKLPQHAQHTGSGSYYEVQFDHYKFIIHELFLSLTALLLKNEKYKLLEELLYSKYQASSSNPYFTSKRLAFGLFYNPINSIDVYYKRLKNIDYSYPMGVLLVERISEIIPKNILISADVLCYFIFEYNIKSNVDNYYDERWVPLTYLSQNYVDLEFFTQLVSKRYFDKVKGLLGVETPQELKTKLSEENDKNFIGSRAYRDTININQIVRPETLATER